jgi:hypothetical protein
LRFVVFRFGGGVFYVIKLLIESHHLQQTHCAGHIKQRYCKEGHPDHLFKDLRESDDSAGGSIVGFRPVSALQTQDLAILIELQIDFGTFFKKFHLLLLG